MDESVSDTVQRTNKSQFLIGCGKVGRWHVRDGNECKRRWGRSVGSQTAEIRTKCLCVWPSEVSECTQRYSIVHTLANVIILSAKSKGLISCYRICSHLDWSHWVNAWHRDKGPGSTSKFCKQYQNTGGNPTPPPPHTHQGLQWSHIQMWPFHWVTFVPCYEFDLSTLSNIFIFLFFGGNEGLLFTSMWCFCKVKVLYIKSVYMQGLKINKTQLLPWEWLQNHRQAGDTFP